MSKNTNTIYRRKGYTLIEIIIAAAIFALLIMVTMAVFGANSSLQLRTDAIREASQNAKFIMEAIARDIRLADKIDISCRSTTGCPSTSNPYTIIQITQGNEIIYYKYIKTTDNKNIIYQETGENNIPETRLNADDVRITAFAISGTDSDVINQQPELKLKITFQAVTGTKVIESQDESIETTITTRNYPNFYKKFTSDENQ